MEKNAPIDSIIPSEVTARMIQAGWEVTTAMDYDVGNPNEFFTSVFLAMERAKLSGEEGLDDTSAQFSDVHSILLDLGCGNYGWLAVPRGG